MHLPPTVYKAGHTTKTRLRQKQKTEMRSPTTQMNFVLSQPSAQCWRKGYVRQHRHAKMAAIPRWRSAAILDFIEPQSADPENPSLEQNMEWIGCTVCEIFAFKLHCDLETGVRGHSRSSKTALFDRAHTTLYSSSILTMPLSLTVSEI